MTQREPFSDELLNAYVDGELDAEDQARIERAMRQDRETRERVDELRRLKHLVASAYADEIPVRASAKLPRSRSLGALAASLAAFALGVSLTWGWFAYHGDGAALRVASEAQSGAPAGSEQAVKVVFHISSDDPGRMSDILNEAEALLSTMSRRGQSVSVRIIASGTGLSLFEKGSAPQAQRIKALKQDYSHKLVFNGCGVAYKQLKNLRADGEFELLPEVQLVDLGVLELMRRQRQGWAYIRL